MFILFVKGLYCILLFNFNFAFKSTLVLNQLDIKFKYSIPIPFHFKKFSNELMQPIRVPMGRKLVMNSFSIDRSNANINPFSYFINQSLEFISSKRINIFNKIDAFRRSLQRKAEQNSLIKLVALLLFLFPLNSKNKAIAAASSAVSADTRINPFQALMLWAILFLISAVLHSGESAITKISPFKVQQFADEEGPKSPFATLSRDLTQLLSTIVLTTTACSIYGTAMFITATSQLFPHIGLGILTAILTIITLLIGEVFPKALAISNSELVARKLVPLISALAALFSPFTIMITFISNTLLLLFGLRNQEDRNVSEDMLRLVVQEAEKSETGIETDEGIMIKNVLDMQDKEVGKIMVPRVEIVAVSEDSTARQILKVAANTKYSRLPVYRDDIDHIIGVLFSKDLLEIDNDEENNKVANNRWETITAKDLMEETYFIPETMSTWHALHEMRKRRIHLSVVVDEYGGTAGIVSLEDILEEVVGEIYDEDDEDEQFEDSKTVYQRADGIFVIRGDAELDDVYEALGLIESSAARDELEHSEYSTIGGLLCATAGQIPSIGDVVELHGYRFSITEVEENRRIVSLLAELIKSDDTRDSEISNHIPNLSSSGGSMDEISI